MSLDHRVFQLRITLNGIEPTVWRRLHVIGETNLRDLYDSIQIAFGWTDSHLHQFKIGKDTYGEASAPEAKEFGLDHWQDEGFLRLSQIVRNHVSFTYEYDFGDSWMHEIKVERIFPHAESPEHPRCVAGENATPPEDSGGPGGYADLLRSLADPSDPDYADNLEWLGGEWDPTAFDLDEVNEDLAEEGADADS